MSQYIALFVVSGSIKELFLTGYISIYLFSFFSIVFAWWKSVGLRHIAYIVIQKSSLTYASIAAHCDIKRTNPLIHNVPKWSDIL